MDCSTFTEPLQTDITGRHYGQTLQADITDEYYR